MKNRFIKYILVFLLGCIFICGCTEEQSQGLTEKEEITLKESYIQEFFNGEKSLKDLDLEHYFGTYGKCIVVLFKDKMSGDNGRVTTKVIDGIEFTYPYGNREVLAFSESKFYTLDKAFDNRLITKDNLYDIANQLKKFIN